MERPPLDVRVWSPSLVLEWLQKLELEQYAAQFLENDIDGEALVLLDDASLRDLGVTSIGHRMTLLSEIFQLKQTHGIQIEPGDWVPQNYEGVPDDVPDITTLLRERDDRIAALEARVAQLSASLLRLREDVVGLARAADKPDAVQQSALLDMPLGPPTSRTLLGTPGVSRSPKPLTPTTESGGLPSRPVTRGRGFVDTPTRRLDTSETQNTSMLRLNTATTSVAHYVGSLAPISDAVGHMLQASGADVPTLPSDESVTIDDTTQTLLLLALRKYHVHDDWHNFALFVHSGTTERCLTYEEKPLLILHRLRDAGNEPWFIVRHLRDVEPPTALAEKKLKVRRRDAGRHSKNPAMWMRAATLDPEEAHADERAFGVTQWVQRAPMHAMEAERALQSARFMGPAAGMLQDTSQPRTYALAIYPYESEREDEFDVRAGDAFIVLAKAKGWWALRRDSLADGRGDVYVPDALSDARRLEVWTGWVPAGCLLETSRPIADLLFAQAIGNVSAASTPVHSTAAMKAAQTRSLRYELIHAPLPLAIVLSAGTQGTLLAQFDAPDGTLSLPAGELLRVFKRYNHWSYCIVDGPSQSRGWVPSWYISRKPNTREPRTLSAGEVMSRHTAPPARLP
ncbi:hypothetical protein CBS14141_000361 [Malassezia furfur]|nr:hypothetical protein CBS14141_000361 [Malassezia furfur]